MRLYEITRNKFKAGGIPYYIDPKTNNTYVVLFLSNNPDYGGDKPAIAKGGSDPGESPEACALREVEEETGINKSNIENIIHIQSTKLQGMTEKYDFHIYGFKLKNKVNTVVTAEGSSTYYEINNALKIIRNSHKPFLQKLKSIIDQDSFSNIG